MPTAPGIEVQGNDKIQIDTSNISDGYFYVHYLSKNPKVKLQITGPDANTYTYNLYKNGYESFPLSAGSGNYKVAVYENIQGTSYSTALSSSDL